MLTDTLEEPKLESDEVCLKHQRGLAQLDCGLLVWRGLKVDDATESKDMSSSERGIKTFDVYNSKLLKVKLSTLILSHLQQLVLQCQTHSNGRI